LRKSTSSAALDDSHALPNAQRTLISYSPDRYFLIFKVYSKFYFNLAKMAERSEAKSAKKTRQKNFNFNFDAKLRFALLVLLRSAIFTENETTN